MLAILVITTLCFFTGLGLAAFARLLEGDENTVVEEINALLPQTQCAQCNFPGCRPYAEAIAKGQAPINQCPPGGDELIKQLARLLDQPIVPLNAEFGTAKPVPKVAVIREDDCIGCTLCIHACPVDAIVGAAKLMHTVVSNECTGCELCLPPCPVDCIDLVILQRGLAHTKLTEHTLV